MAQVIPVLTSIGGLFGASGTAATLIGAGTAALATKGAIGAVSGGKKTEAAPAPVVEKGPVVMPLADDGAVQRAKRRSIAAQMSRSGRSSTMLTSDSDKLGG